MSKERPILMQGAMVRSTLADLKTNTRRVLMIGGSAPSGAFWDHPAYEPVEIRYGAWAFRAKSAKSLVTAAAGSPVWKCPYGTVGDHLWVRETFQADGALAKYGTGRVKYRADGADADRVFGAWKPSIFMPRWASRITLEITGVRVERVQDISEEDAVAEGLLSDDFPIGGNHVKKYGIEGWEHRHWRQSPVDAFERLWDSINKKRGFGWDTNCWVWCLSFRRIPDNPTCKKPVDAAQPPGVE